MINHGNTTSELGNTNPPTRYAAMYVRMSTDHQKYSTENQADAIREYAARNHIDIIETYADAGKSGLKLDGRDALKRLIDDVQSGNARFNMILVLDVTRWGRFQDADESAYYEYICRRAGIDVQYVAEQFENDGSPVSTIVKGVKRAMAGEYSRELSTKVFAGQCRLIELGYRQGGHAGYGLRRVLIDEQGNIKSELKRGEHKSLQTDRVILVPGPAEEIETVRWIYRAFTEESMQESQIAAVLNQRGILTDLGRSWTRGVVHQILTNEKYIGNNVFNRISFKLKKRRVANTPDMWVRADGVFEAVVEPSYFYTAQGIIRERGRKFSDNEMLDKLRQLHERQGWLSGILIDEADSMPSSSAYAHRFGSLIRAYELIGYTPDRDYRYIEINRHLRQMYAGIVEDTIRKIKDLGGHVRREVTSDLLFVNDELKVSIVICRCQETKVGHYRWKIQLDSGLEPDITIAIRMDAENKQPLDYYLLPSLDMENPNIRLQEENGLALDAYRFDDLELFFLMAERIPLREAA
jgi:DNA invertase Pin-like site-specific DNA recombinase